MKDNNSRNMSVFFEKKNMNTHTHTHTKVKNWKPAKTERPMRSYLTGCHMSSNIEKLSLVTI